MVRSPEHNITLPSWLIGCTVLARFAGVVVLFVVCFGFGAMLIRCACVRVSNEHERKKTGRMVVIAKKLLPFSSAATRS